MLPSQSRIHMFYSQKQVFNIGNNQTAIYSIAHTCINICNTVARNKWYTCYARVLLYLLKEHKTKYTYKKLSAITHCNHWWSFFEFVYVWQKQGVLGTNHITQLLMHFYHINMLAVLLVYWQVVTVGAKTAQNGRR